MIARQNPSKTATSKTSYHARRAEVLFPMERSSEPVKKYDRCNNYCKRSDALVLACNFPNVALKHS